MASLNGESDGYSPVRSLRNETTFTFKRGKWLHCRHRKEGRAYPHLHEEKEEKWPGSREVVSLILLKKERSQ